MFQGHLRQDKGQAFVELALILPVFLLLLVGTAEVGRLTYASIEVSNAARAGVAYAAQSHTTAQDTTNIQAAANNGIAARNSVGMHKRFMELRCTS